MEIKIESLKDAEKYFEIIFGRLDSVEQGLLDEIIHLRKEITITNEKLDENTQEIKVLNKKFESLDSNVQQLDTTVRQMDKNMSGGFENVGKILQEISNKLDK